MSHRHAAGLTARRYEIIVAGRLADDWPDWFGPAEVAELADGTSRIIAAAPDPAAVQGLLAQVAALNLTLIAVRLLSPPADADSAR